MFLYLKLLGEWQNRVDPDQMPHSAASDLGLHCLLRPVCPNTRVNMIPYIAYMGFKVNTRIF